MAMASWGEYYWVRRRRVTRCCLTVGLRSSNSTPVHRRPSALISYISRARSRPFSPPSSDRTSTISRSRCSSPLRKSRSARQQACRSLRTHSSLRQLSEADCSSSAC